ncbi:MAG TPA: cytochrome c maturation protein CcmE [Acetobacteraceae bacterium]|nr:cytochrome c maturation protein CcmE [Acetobacteraceae bacterium]
MTRKRRRLLMLGACLAGLGTATGLALAAFSGSLVFFVTPSDLAAKPGEIGRMVRLGGLVQQGSVVHAVIGGRPFVRFRITDGHDAIPVTFTGLLPGLFREGQGVVVTGHLAPGGIFRADEVLAKHDADYMPPAVVQALKKRGLWNPDAGPPPPAATWDTMRLPAANQSGG